MYSLFQGDCLDRMDEIATGSVDMILADLPYGTTRNPWDAVIAFGPLWDQYRRVAKPNAAIVLTASQPFTTDLINSNRKQFRYELIWDKVRGCNFANARKQPMKSHENICVFYGKRPTYNPQFWFSTPYKTKPRRRSNEIAGLVGGSSAANADPGTDSPDGRRYPLSIITRKRDGGRLHTTAKPVSLMAYLIRTYTNPGEVVLDNVMGSGSTGVAALNEGRKFIGIEKDAAFYAIACNRIVNAGGVVAA